MTNERGQLDLAGYEVLVGVSGGIAVFKVCQVVSSLVQRGAGVTVAMTSAAQRFVAPLTFQALSGRTVLTNLWTSDGPSDVQHISVTERADLIVVAPATANLIGKLASGIADEIVSTLIISAASPVLLAPAMNERMWNNPVVQRNVESLRSLNYDVVGPGEGWLACRTVGVGRLAEPVEIVEAVTSILNKNAPKRASERDDCR